MSIYSKEWSFENSFSKKDLLYIFAGSCSMALASHISFFLPGNPVPITMQTFAVFMLGFFLGPKRGALSVLAFLAEATVGIPVLSTGCNPLWLISPRGGYLLGFSFAAFIIGVLTQKSKKTVHIILSFLLGDIVLYALGCSVLAFFVGWASVPTIGLYPFLSGEAYKIIAATCLAKGTSKWLWKS